MNRGAVQSADRIPAPAVDSICPPAPRSMCITCQQQKVPAQAADMADLGKQPASFIVRQRIVTEDDA